ncbi:LamG domain-containing protein [Streptomyces flavidovirens]|uniref:LamG domain-containing protein n=1 Tax=Streptomyces flavidovirens TaxID=67298 RepID=UPI003687758D
MGVAVAAAVVAGVLSPVASVQAAPRAAAEQAKTGVASQTALAEAASTGESVEVVAERTEYSQTVANPDGTFTLTQASTPQRIRNADGAWRDIDVALERRSDGSVGPKAAVVDLAFSGGGPGGEMLRLGGKRGSLSLGWPKTLPEPTLSGATATYAEVLPGVDLQLTATAEGYREVLVVKTAEAAANPELEQVRLSADSDVLELVQGAGGGLRALDQDGNAVFVGPAGQMWDSAGDTGTGPQLARTAVGVTPSADGPEGPEGPTHPGDGDASAELPVTVTEGAVTVKPDLALLRGETTVYPVYIDPPVGLGASERAVLSSDGDRYWQFDGDYGVGHCSRSGPWYCTTGATYTNRMLFEFAPSKLVGKYVVDATFRARETWSFDCNPKWVNLVRTDNISESTRWPGPAELDLVGDRYVSAGRGDYCSPDQPDAWIEFNDNPDEPDENLRNSVRSYADGKISRLTLSLKAKDEGDAYAWKRFDDNAELQVTYVPKPGVPSDVGLIPGDGATGYCRTSSSDPLIVTRKDPKVLARVQTQVQPKNNEEQGSLQAEFVVERQMGSSWDQVWSDYRPRPGWDPDGTLEGVRMTERAEGGVYRYKSRTQSHWSYGSASGNLFSPYSKWCYFKIDSTAPKAPQITAVSPYTQCAAVCEGKGGPGVPGKFTFKPNSADTDIVGYRWRLTSLSGAKTVSGSSVTVSDVTPPLGGTQILSVEARDVRERWGAPADFLFKVAPAEGAVGRWHFDDYQSGSVEKTARDTASVGTRHHATMYTDGSGFSSLARRGDEDQSLWLDSSDPDKQKAYAATSAPAVNTKDSFTVSTWVSLTDASVNRVALSEPGSKTSGFVLYYSTAYKAWVFNRSDKDQDNPVYLRSVGKQQNPPLRVWTHLAGVFDTKGDTDKANDTIQLYVNGRPQGSPVILAKVSATYEPWTASGGLQFGRSLNNTGTNGALAGQEFFRGRLDEPTVWQRALTGDEVAEDAQVMENGVAANELVAAWDASASTGTEVKESSPYPIAGLKLSASGAVLDQDDNALVLDGTVGYAAATGPLVDESGSFTVSTQVRLNKTKLDAKPAGYKAQVAGQRAGGESSWALWVIKPAAGVYQWKFTRTAIDAAGKVTQSAEIAPLDQLADVDTWADVTGVFDAQEAWEWTDPSDGATTETRYGKLHLFIGQAPVNDETGKAGFTAGQHGSGEIAAGRGAAAGAVGNYLPGALQGLRIWTGAMSADQVSSQVLDSEALITPY